MWAGAAKMVRIALWVAVMAEIEIYSTAVCPYCIAAKNLLQSKGLQWHEFRIDADPAARRTLLQRVPGARTVPQIFINGAHVGGFDELAAAERSGELDRLLAAGAPTA